MRPTCTGARPPTWGGLQSGRGDIAWSCGLAASPPPQPVHIPRGGPHLLPYSLTLCEWRTGDSQAMTRICSSKQVA